MTEWTPKIEKLISDYAAYENKNSQDGRNPKQTVIGSLLRVAFRQAVTKNGNYAEVCAEMGLNAKEYNKNIQKMIELAQANNCDAAKTLVATRSFWKNYAVASEGGFINSIKATAKVAKKLSILKKQ